MKTIVSLVSGRKRKSLFIAVAWCAVVVGFFPACASRSQFQKGYERGASDTVKRQYWILQNMQKAGLEWLFRFLEEPKRLWKRYAVGLAKFSIMLAPPLAVHFLLKTFLRERGGALRKRLFFSGEEIVQVIALPDHLNAESIKSVYQCLEEEIDAILVLDASEFRCVDAAGFGFLWQMLSDHHDKG